MATPFEEGKNYVAPTSGGGYVAVVNGVEHPAGTQAQAEQIYNNLTGGGGGPGPAASSGGGGGGVYQTREGPRSIGDIRQGIIAAGGTPTGDDAQDVAMFNNAGGGPGSPGGGGPGRRDSGNPDYYNVPYQNAAWNYDLGLQRLNRLDIPSLEFEKDYRNRQLEQQGGQFGQQLSQQESQFARSLGLSERQLAELTATREGQQRLQEILGRGQLALGGLGLASQEALARRGQGLQAAQIAAETFGGPENAFKQQQLLGMLDPASGGLNFLSGDRGAPLYQAPTGVGQPRDLSAALGRIADVGGQSPTIGAATAMAGPNSEYATPGSVLQQIPGLGQRYLDAATRASQSGYGVVTDPAQLTARIDQLVRANPEWQRASQTGDVATKTRIERQGFAEAAGLPEDLVNNVYAQTEAYRRANGGQTMPMDQVAQLVQAQAGAVKQRRLQALAQETLGFDPQTAQQFVGDWQNQWNANGGQLPASQDLERDVARRYGYGTGTPPNPMGGSTIGGQPYTAPGAPPPAGSSAPGAFQMGPGTMNYQRQAQVQPYPRPQMAGDPRPGQPYAAPGGSAMRTTASLGQPYTVPTQNPTVALARQTLGGVTAPNQINARNFLRAPRSTQQFTLAAGEAGYGWDKQDAAQQIQRTLPRAVGPRRGMLAGV